MRRRDLFTGAATVFAAAMTSRAESSPMLGDGFFVPAEEQTHQCTFMQWPVSRKVHPDSAFLADLQRTIADIANVISVFEPVIMLAAASEHGIVRRYLSERVELWDVATEDLWCRDSGPLFMIDDRGAIAVRGLQFNGWGNRQVHKRDGQIARKVAERLGLPVLPCGLRGEAGAVEQDGHGLLMAHESSWVHKNRNPGMTRNEIEAELLAAYGADQMIWAPGVKNQDITDYHIDSLARFTGAGRVLINLPDEPDMSDSFHRAALETYGILKRAQLDVTVIPEPVQRRVKSIDFVASYANYYVCNGAVIAAQFGDDETDERAAHALRRQYPGREVIMLNVDPLGEVGGGIHCATQQMPKVG